MNGTLSFYECSFSGKDLVVVTLKPYLMEKEFV